jgi:hypothetical protein
MAKTIRTIKPPFSWLGAHGNLVAVSVAVLLGGFFRFFRLDNLPPGIGSSAASSGLDSLRLLNEQQLPGLNVSNNYAPLWVWLQALPIQLFGPTELALRLWPALLGTLAVLTMWLWLKNWFGQRIAWMGAFLLAVIPWGVTLSRNGTEAAAIPLLVTLLLWLLTLAWRSGSALVYVALATTILAALLLGPIGWMMVAGLALFGLVHLYRNRKKFELTRPRTIGLVSLAVVLAVAGYLFGTALGVLVKLPAIAHVTADPGVLWHNLIRTLLMLSVPGAGDQNYQHNLAGQAMFNVFVGLMLVAGLLVSISRLHNRRYRWLLGLTAFLLLPAIVTNVGVPNAGRAIAALPLLIAIAAVGISYMLELWYATFPINSAARTMGQSAILLLIGLTIFQGYTHYFRAWGGSSEVHTAYHEGTAQLANNLRTDKFIGARFVVAPEDQQLIVAYLNYGGTSYQPIKLDSLVGLPNDPGPRKFYLMPTDRQAAMKVIQTKFPGGILRPHYSLFNQTENYYTYETSK